MKVELTALWAFLFLVNSLNLRKVQIFGDSQVVVEWVKGKVQIQVACFQPLMRRIHDLW
jgi:ribonuclease HI